MQNNRKQLTARRKQPCWAISDLLDYDYFLYLDENESHDETKTRDRAIYLSGFAGNDTTVTDHRLATCWLNARRKQVTSEALPGHIFAGIKKYINLIPALIGIVLGSTYGAGVLKYSGETAINLPTAFGFLVAFPLSLSILSLLLMVMRVQLIQPARLQGLWNIIYKLFGRYAMPTEQKRRKTDAFFNSISIRIKKYGTIPGWTAKHRQHCFTLSFQIGSLAAVILTGMVHDLAFGWESTADVAPQSIHKVVESISAPWNKWTDNGSPTIDNIIGSRLILKEGLDNNDDADLKSWWPFIFYAMFFYAVLPKLALVLISGIAGRRALCRIDFNEAQSRALFRRMTLPQLTPNSDFVPKPALRGSASDQVEAAGTPALTEHNVDGAGPYSDTVYNVLRPDDISTMPEDQLSQIITANTHGRLGSVLTVEFDEEDDLKTWKQLPENESILIIQEAWQPCTTEILEYLRALRGVVGTRRLITIGLLETTSGSRNTLFSDWRYQLKTLRDPLLDAVQLTAK